MCKLMTAKPKSGVIRFEIDVKTPVVLYLKKKKTLFTKNLFEKVTVQELIKQTCLATVKRHVDDIFVYNFKA